MYMFYIFIHINKAISTRKNKCSSMYTHSFLNKHVNIFSTVNGCVFNDTIMHASLSATGHMKYKERFTVTCHVGYELHGTGELVCREFGFLSDKPRCERK